MSTTFDRDTAVRRRPTASHDAPTPDNDGGASHHGASAAVATAALATTAIFDADVSPDWRAGRGPHGGYLAAMLLRALTETVAEKQRAPRSLTIHYARAPEPGPVEIHTAIERAGRSLSTLSARMEQDGKLMALALSAFSVPWHAPEISELPLPDVEPAEPRVDGPRPPHPMAPPFARHMEFQPRMGTRPFTGADAPMEVGGWIALSEPRPLDALALAFFSDALFSPPFIRMSAPAVTPTIDLTIHFRASLAPIPDRATDLDEHCFARFSSTVVHEGFFEEDGVIWAADGTVLVHSRQLAIVMPIAPDGHVRR
ncbi:MAG TPA: thioesterase family protein [Solirubrobacteraceae bacterium]|jgi:acyl-CoA thioesterase